MTREARAACARLARETMLRHPGESARVLDGQPVEDVARLVSSLPAREAAELVARMTPEVAAALLERLDDGTARDVLTLAEPVRAAALLHRIGDGDRARLLAVLEPATARELRSLLSYSPDSAGALMDPHVMALFGEATVANALDRLRTFTSRRVRRVFVIDTEGRPVGSIRLQDLAMAQPDTRLRDLMGTPPPVVRDTAGREEVVDLLTRTRVASIPVVDFDGRVLGVIRDDVLLNAVEAEATADVQTMVGASREERALSPARFAVRKRLPWLQVNLGTAFLAASVVGLFESMIAQYTALAVLLPVVAGQSGNTGAQALAVTMRGLALREVRVRHWLRVALKEGRVAVVNGVAVALTTAAAVWLWSDSPGLALVIGLAMVVSMAAAGLAGAAIPMVLTAAGQDPAQSSSIILTTVTDVVGFFSFLGIATMLSGLL